jgi:hypothetical protein
VIKSGTCYWAACDVCDATVESDYGYGIDHYDDPHDALEKAHDDEWWATEGIVLCQSQTAEHEAQARATAERLAGKPAPEGEGFEDFVTWCERTFGEEFADSLRPRFDAAMADQAELPTAAG